MAGRWFIPYELTGAETLEEFSSAQLMPRLETLIGNEHGPVHELFSGDEPFVLNIGHLHLSREQASEFKRRLWAVLKDCETGETPGLPEYTLALMLARGAVD